MRRERIAVRLVLALAPNDLLKLLDRACRANHSEFPHEDDHCVEQRSLALEGVDGVLADMIEEVVKGRAEEKNLQNLYSVRPMRYHRAGSDIAYRIHITHVTTVHQTPRLDMRNDIRRTDAIRSERFRERVGRSGEQGRGPISSVRRARSGTTSRDGRGGAGARRTGCALRGRGVQKAGPGLGLLRDRGRGGSSGGRARRLGLLSQSPIHLRLFILGAFRFQLFPTFTRRGFGILGVGPWNSWEDRKGGSGGTGR